jgi:hypothetical protein
MKPPTCRTVGDFVCAEPHKKLTCLVRAPLLALSALRPGVLDCAREGDVIDYHLLKSPEVAVDGQVSARWRRRT